jgi:hypothetical protein
LIRTSLTTRARRPTRRIDEAGRDDAQMHLEVFARGAKKKRKQGGLAL